MDYVLCILIYLSFMFIVAFPFSPWLSPGIIKSKEIKYYSTNGWWFGPKSQWFCSLSLWQWMPTCCLWLWFLGSFKFQEEQAYLNLLVEPSFILYNCILCNLVFIIIFFLLCVAFIIYVFLAYFVEGLQLQNHILKKDEKLGGLQKLQGDVQSELWFSSTGWLRKTIVIFGLHRFIFGQLDN